LGLGGWVKKPGQMLAGGGKQGLNYAVVLAPMGIYEGYRYRLLL